MGADACGDAGATTAKIYESLYDFHIAPTWSPEAGRADARGDRALAGRADRGGRRDGVGAEGADAAGTILQLALESERIARNPVRLVRKARRPAKGEVRPLAPATVEAMRAAADERDATLISVLAYAGLRPQEALALRWRDVGQRTIMSNAPKTGQRRNVRLLAPLLEDLKAWRSAQDTPRGDALVFPGHDGEPWAADAYKSWAKKPPRGASAGAKSAAGSPGPFARAAMAAGAPDATPYTLRHSFCSLLLHEGRSVIYVARQLGHDAKLTLSTYGHVIDELEDAPRVPQKKRSGPRDGPVCHRCVRGGIDA